MKFLNKILDYADELVAKVAKGLTQFAKFLGNISVFIYAAVMFFGNIGMTMLVTELALGAAPILWFNGAMVTAYLIAFFSRYLK